MGIRMLPFTGDIILSDIVLQLLHHYVTIIIINYTNDINTVSGVSVI